MDRQRRVIRPEDAEGRPLLVTVAEAAHMLRIGRSTLYELLSDNAIAHIKVGRSTRILFSELERWIREQSGLGA